MRKILAVLIGLAVVAPSAYAETTLSAGVKVTPSISGTSKRPQGVKLTIGYDLTTTDGEVHPIVTGFEVWHGPGLAFDQGGPYAACSRTVLGRLGPDGYPPGSILGRGPAYGIEPPDLEAAPKFVVLNGRGRRLLAYMTLQRPARVRAVVPSVPTHNPRSIWPHRTAWTLPQSMRVVAGIPITINHFKYTYGYTKAARLYVSTTSCPKGGWKWRIRVHTDSTPVLQQDGRVPCSRR